MSTEAGLIATVMTNPKDATPLLVYADWLQEQDRAADESEVRTLAEHTKSGFGVLTWDEVTQLPNSARYDAETNWIRWWKRMVERAARAAIGPELIKKHGLYLSVDLNADALSYHRKRPSLGVFVGGFKNKKSFPIGKSGFNVDRIVAELVRQATDEIARQNRASAASADAERAQLAAAELDARFGFAGRHDSPLRPAKTGTDVVFSVSLPAARMEELLRLLNDNGFLNRKS